MAELHRKAGPLPTGLTEDMDIAQSIDIAHEGIEYTKSVIEQRLTREGKDNPERERQTDRDALKLLDQAQALVERAMRRLDEASQ